MRLFFALMPPAPVVPRLARAAADVPVHGRRVPPANFHVTLVFVGTVDAAGYAACEQAGSRVVGTAFDLVLSRAGTFTGARVAWLGPQDPPPALGTLVADLRTALTATGIRYDPKPFRCHVTIARDVRGAPGPEALPPVAWPVREFALVESVSGSAGVRYESRVKWPLRPACRDETATSPVQ